MYSTHNEPVIGIINAQ